MAQQLFSWTLNIINVLGSFGNWLITPLDYINMSPLSLFSLGGITLLLGIHLIRLFIG